MAAVIPFRAWRYHLDQIDMAKVAAPPYDIISPAEQEALYRRDPHNIVRIELRKEEVGQGGGVDKYESARREWESWIQNGVVKQDQAKSFYLYETRFLDPKSRKRRRRIVIFGLIQLEPFETKTVLPHERTHAKPKEDRFKLLTATRTNFSPVFGLYKDPKKIAQILRTSYQSTPPLFSFILENGETHTLWQIGSSKDVSVLSQMFESKSILIADGHHRYETALNFRNETRKAYKQAGKQLPPEGSLPCDYALMGFVELEDEGLLIFPIHRIIQDIPRFDAKEFFGKLSPLFTHEVVDDRKLGAIAKGEIRAGFGLRSREASFYLKLKDEARARKEMPSGKPEIWYQLAVAQISHLLLKHLGIVESTLERHLTYTHSAEEAIEKVKTGNAALSLIVPPVQADVMQTICASGELMPQKSTYFYPKLGSGILMYRHG